MTDCDDGDHISVFDFGGVKKKSKKGLVIMVHGSWTVLIIQTLGDLITRTLITTIPTQQSQLRRDRIVALNRFYKSYNSTCPVNSRSYQSMNVFG